jgi:hypothetical protein
MTPWRRSSVRVLAAGGAFAGAVACTGDDPDLTTTRREAGAGDGSLEDEGLDAGPPKRVFVTSELTNGAFGDGDAICNRLAANAARPGTFKAWLGVGDVSALSRLAWIGGYALVDGTLVARSRRRLLEGPLLAPIALTETGARADPKNLRVWTNTTITGAIARPGYDCQRFQRTLPDDGGPAASPGGLASEVDGRWTNSAAISCSDEAHLYCFED